MPTKARSEEILDAALAVFSKAGFHKARIEDIAERAGVAKGTVYLYFPGKKELFCALIERTTENHLRTVESLLEGPGAIAGRLVLVAGEHLSFFASGKETAGLNILNAVRSDADLEKKMLTYRDRYVKLIATALANSAEMRALAEPPSAEYCRDAAVAFTGLLHGFMIEIKHGDRHPDEQKLPQRMVALFLQGFLGNGAKPE